AGERLAPHDLAGEAQGGPHLADLVLEELPEGLEEPELHPGGQPPHVVVALDQGRRVVAYRDALDDVGIEGALSQEVGVPYLLERLLEDLDEGVADDLALALGVVDTPEPPEEERRRVDDPQVNLEVPLVERLDHRALVLAQEPVVDEYARELAPYRPVDQRRRDRGVHPAGEPQDDPRASDRRPDPPGR